MRVLGIIPARYASSRFPGKPLADIKGKSMIRRVYEQARKSAALSDVIIATDDSRIEKHAGEFGAHAVLTSAAHPSGTDRCAEAVEKYSENKPDVIVNIQGDEPFIHPRQIDLVCSLFSSPEVQIATLVKKITSIAELKNPNIPKVIVNNKGYAQYFSRSPVPFLRDVKPEEWTGRHVFFKHIGIYAYRAEILTEITKLPPSSWELAEALEQLRWLQNGYFIKTELTDLDSFAIDTPDDLEKIPPVF